MRWGVERRLEFIEFRLFWEGSINRGDIVDTFGVSVPQASKDLSLYQERAPGNMEYDTREKRYVAQPSLRFAILSQTPTCTSHDCGQSEKGRAPHKICGLDCCPKQISQSRRVAISISKCCDPLSLRFERRIQSKSTTNR